MQQPAPFSQAIRRKYPEPVVLVVTCDPQGKVDLTPAGWSCPASGQPPMLLVALQHGHHSTANIKATGEFVIAFPGAGQADAVLFCGRHSGRDTDKLAATGLAVEPAGAVRPPLVAEAAANFECRLAGSLVAGDHLVFTGEVLAAHQHPDPQLRRLYVTGPDQHLGAVGEGERKAGK